MSAQDQRRSPRRLAIATVLLGPAAVFVSANVLQHGFGLDGAADWLDPIFVEPSILWLPTALVIVGPVVALLLAATRLFPIRLLRDGDAWEVRIRVRSDLWAIAVASLSLVVGVILAGYLVAENLACVIGIRSSC